MSYSPVACASVTIALSGIVCVAVAIRFYVRVRIQNHLFLDDLFSALATAIFIALAAQYIVGTLRDGVGKLSDEISEETFGRGLKAALICQLLYFIATYLIKLSFIFTLFRIVSRRAEVYTLYALISIGAVLTVLVWFWLLFFCAPLPFFWQQFTESAIDGSCKSLSSLIIITIVHAGWILLADLLLGFVMPAFLLRNLQMHTRTKVSVWLLLAIGSIPSVATVVRIVYISALSMSEALRDNNRAIFWSMIEIAISIASTAAATWKPLMVRLKIFKHSSFANYTVSLPPTKAQGTRKRHQNTSWPHSWVELGARNTSEEDILSGIHIHTTTEVQIDREQAKGSSMDLEP